MRLRKNITNCRGLEIEALSFWAEKLNNESCVLS